MERSIKSVLSKHANSNADLLAFGFLNSSGERQNLTFKELHNSSNGIARSLLAKVNKGDRVVILLPQGLEYIQTFVACLMANVIAVPLYPPRKNQHSTRIEKVVENCHPTLIITTPELVGMLQGKYLSAKVADVATLLKEVSVADKLEAVKIAESDVAFLQYTSGSTGLPKGVMITHGNIVANLESLIEASKCDKSDIFCNWLPLFHDLGLINTLLLPIYIGAQSIIMAPMHFMRRPLAWLNAISECRATISGAPNFAFDYCLEKLPPEKISHLDLSSWRVAFNAAEPIKEDTLLKFSQRFKPQGFDEKAFFPSYGMAEATVFISSIKPEQRYNCYRFEPQLLERGQAKQTSEQLGVDLISCGKAQSDHELVILDTLTDQVLPEGSIGQVCFSGPSVGAGYWDDEARTAECFNIKVKGLGGSFLKTGDLGFLLRGEIFITGRMKDLMIVNGRNLYPQDFESLIYEHNSFIRPNGVVAFEQNSKCYLAIEVEKSEQHKIDFNTAAQMISKAIFVEFDVVPEDIVFVRAGSLSKTSSGKVQRALMKQRYFSEDLVIIESLIFLNQSTSFAQRQPESITEKALSLLWEDALQQENLSVDKSFFSLGGNSITALKLLTQIEQKFEVFLSIEDLLVRDDIASLAKYIDDLMDNDTLVAIPSRSNIKQMPLTTMQQSLLFAEENGSAGLYTLTLALRLSGEIDFKLLEQSLSVIIGRHSALRIRLDKGNDGEVLQRVEENWEFSLHSIDNTDEQFNSSFEEIFRDIETKKVDFYNALPLKAYLIKQGEQESVFVAAIHHLFVDGWSQQIILDELACTYNALKNGESVSDLEVEPGYFSFVEAQQDWMQSDAFSSSLNYWKTRLHGIPERHSLPADFPRGKNTSVKCHLIEQQVKPALVNRLNNLAAQNSTTLNTLYNAAFALLNYKLSGQQDVVFGYPISNRPNSSFNHTVGCFVNTVVARIKVNPDATIQELLTHCKDSLIEATRYHQIPFSILARELGGSSDTNYNPLIQTLIIQEQSSPRLNIAGVGCERLSMPEYSEFDLTLRYEADNQGSQLNWLYNPELFSEETMQRNADYFKAVLTLMTKSLEVQVGELQLLTQHDLELLRDWNHTSQVFSGDICTHEMFELQVEKTPNAVAVNFCDIEISYLVLNKRANRLGRYLRENYHVGTDSLVAVCLERSVDMVVALLAIMKAGGAYVPIDTSLPKERAQFILEDSDAKAVLSQKQFHEHFDFAGKKVLLLDSQGLSSELKQFGDSNISASIPKQASTSLAYAIYTSGSTGKPKGVLIEHKSLLNRIEWGQRFYTMTANDRVMQKTPYSFDISVWEFFWPLFYGATLVVAEPEKHKDPFYLQRLIREKSITIIHFVPTMLNGMMMADAWQAFDSLRYVFCTGEALSKATVANFYAISPNIQLTNLYGPTEATIEVSYYDCDKDIKSLTVPIGKPMQNMALYVLNESLQQVPIGAAGELYISGVCLARGYLNRDDLNQHHFVDNPFYEKGMPDYYARMYRTGDIARWLYDGNIEYLGRNDHQIKVRGFRIELGEIEAVLIQHDAIEEAAVKATNDDSETLLVAYYRPTKEAVDTDEITFFLSKSLPEYMVPTHYVALEQFPVTTSGKVDRKKLPDIVLETCQQEFIAPETPTEVILAAIWRELLGNIKVGRYDNFFSLGGNSVLVPALMARAQSHGYKISIRQIYESRNLAILAGSAEASHTNLSPGDGKSMSTSNTDALLGKLALNPQCPDVEMIQNILPLSLMQESFLLHHQLSNDCDPYIPNVGLVAENNAQFERFLQAVEFLVARHDILRASFVWSELEQPVQIIHREATLKAKHWDVEKQMTDSGAMAELKSRITQRIDLSQAPCWFLNTLKTKNSDKVYMILQMHHIVYDAVSLTTIFEDLLAYYNSAEGALPIPANYGKVLQDSLSSVDTTAAELFFREHLLGFDTPAYPFGLYDMQAHEIDKPRRKFDIPIDLSDRIRKVTQSLGVTPSVFFHVVWANVVALCSGQQDVVFGTVFSGRSASIENAEKAVAVLINTLPIRINLVGQSCAELLHSVHCDLGEMSSYESMPLTSALSQSGLDANIPLFSAILNYSRPLDIPEASKRLSEKAGIVIEEPSESTNYPFDLSVNDLGIEAAFLLDLQVNREVNIDRIVDYMVSTVTAMLTALESGGEQLAISLPLLPEKEKQEQLTEWNAQLDAQVDTSFIHRAIEVQAQKSLHDIAVVHNDKTMSYLELNQGANQMARLLVDRYNVKPGDMVGICVPRSFAMIQGILGILKAGATYVPFDPKFPEQRLMMILDEVSLQACIAESNTPLARVISKDKVLSPKIYSATEYSIEDFKTDELSLTREDIAYVMFTSGTTGKPKGVMVSHRAISHRCGGWMSMFDFDTPPTVLQMASLSVDICLADMIKALTTGGRLVLCDHETLLSPQLLYELINEKQVTYGDFVPGVIRSLVNYLSESQQTLQGMSHICIGCEAWSGKELNGLRAILDSKTKVINLYGQTESVVDVSYLDTTGQHYTDGQIIPIGRSIPGSSIYITNELGMLQPIGVPGEICIGGDAIASGYFNNLELTSEKFKMDFYNNSSSAKMFCTGDFAKRKECGELEFIGRKDDQVRVRGYRVELSEVESAIMEYEGISKAVAAVKEWPDHEIKLVGYFEQEGHELDIFDLRRFLALRLPDYQVPSLLVSLDNFPLTPTGKVDRKALPIPSSDEFDRQFLAPRTYTEKRLCEIWQELLSVERVGAMDDFFAVGGHSLLASKLAVRVQTAFGVELPIKDIFDKPVLSEQAEFVAKVVYQKELKVIREEKKVLESGVL